MGDRVLLGKGVLDLPERTISVLERNGYEGCFSIEMLSAVLWRLRTNEAHEYAFLEQAIAVDEIFPWARTCRREEHFGS